jgi:hypothetical protein
MRSSGFLINNAAVSPDGRWLAYQTDESGRDEIYVRPFPDVDAGLWQVSTGGGRQPVWARTGRELFYLTIGGGALMRVPIENAASWSAGLPSLFLNGPFYDGAGSGASPAAHPTYIRMKADGTRQLRWTSNSSAGRQLDSKLDVRNEPQKTRGLCRSQWSAAISLYIRMRFG